MTTKGLSESDIQRQILDYLKLHRIWHRRHNTGGASFGKRFVRFGVAGDPDIICCIKGRFVAIECKSQRNSAEQSQAQRCCQSDLEAAGGKYILAHSLEDVIRGLKP